MGIYRAILNCLVIEQVAQICGLLDPVRLIEGIIWRVAPGYCIIYVVYYVTIQEEETDNLRHLSSGANMIGALIQVVTVEQEELSIG